MIDSTSSLTVHVHAAVLALAAAGICCASLLAGLSRLHWFWRVSMLCLPLLLLLPIRAYEPLVLLFPLMVALAFSAAALRSRWERELKLPNSTTAALAKKAKVNRWSLSLRDAMLTMTVTGVGLAILAQLPWRGLSISWGGLLFDATLWYSLSLICLGLIGFRGGWMWAVALFICVSLGIVFEANFGDGLRALYLIGVAGPQHLTWAPLAEFYLIFAALLLVGLWLIRWSWSATEKSHAEQPRVLAQRRRLVGSLAMLAATPAVMMYIAMFVGPPAVATPRIRNNSLPHLVAMAEEIQTLGVGEMTQAELKETYPNTKLDEQVDRLCQQSLQMVKQPGSVSLDSSLQTNEHSLTAQEAQLTLLRGLARRWSREADYSIRKGDVRRAVDFDLAILRLGNYLSRGGIRMHVQAAYGIKSDGLAQLTMLRDRLPMDLVPAVIHVLELLDAGEENPQLTTARDRYWTDIAHGWRNRLEIVVQRLLRVPSTETAAFQALKMPLSREAAQRRLLGTDLALRLYKHEMGSYPESLADLVPTRLAMMPRDPFTQQPLVYRPVQFGYALYSTGPDANDDGGKFARFGEGHNYVGVDWNLESVMRFGWRRGERSRSSGPGFGPTPPRLPGTWTRPPWERARGRKRPDLVSIEPPGDEKL